MKIQFNGIVSQSCSKLVILSFFAFNSLVAQNNNSGKPNVELHVRPDLGNCDFDIAPNLTQSEWRRATYEIGNALYLNPLSSAKPLGRGNWTLFIENNSFYADQVSGAWNNTFHHPDSTHYLAGENGRISVPALRFKMGITSKWEAGVYYTSTVPFGANYGFVGIESKYAFQFDSISGWSTAIRASYVRDANIRDFNIHSTGIEAMASKQLWNMLTPYAAISVNWNHSKEVTDDVVLGNVNTLAVHGIAGIDFNWRYITLGYEFMIGNKVGNRALKIGVVF